MSLELWSATLNPDGPNYQHWHSVLGSDRVPLESPTSMKVRLGSELDVEVYMLKLSALTLKQRASLIGFIARKFSAPIYEVEAEITKAGFPIRAADVIVSISMRAVI